MIVQCLCKISMMDCKLKNSVNLDRQLTIYVPKFHVTILAIEREISYIYVTRTPENCGRIPGHMAVVFNLGLCHYRDGERSLGTDLMMDY